MFQIARLLQVTCVVTCLVAVPWTNAFAADRTEAAAAEAPAAPALRASSIVFGDALTADETFSLTPKPPVFEAKRRQTVASTNQPKLLLGVAAGALIVSGVAMLAYSATSTCKGLHETTNACDKKAVIGSMGVSGGTVMLVVWALSRP